jgi:hypothetical protein
LQFEDENTSVSYENDASQNGGMWGMMMMSSMRCHLEKKPPRTMFFQYLKGGEEAVGRGQVLAGKL